MEKQKIRVRFAPSPTGHLHIGSLRTALFNWLFARHNSGAFLLRIEDTDLERSKQEYVDSILNSLSWAELKVDEPMVIQSQRINEHETLIDQLLSDGHAYRCFCLPDDLVARIQKKTDEDFFIQYDGYCRERISQEAGMQKPHVVRFKLPDDQTEVTFADLIRGPVTIGLDQLDDFIIARSDGRPMYNFVVVADDAYMKISHVIRGEDHIVNTSKQLLLYKALGYTPPQFAHIPLILGPSGDRLSKRDGATSVLEYRKDGFLADALVNYLARLGWSHGDQEIFTREELISYFTLDQVGKKGAIFDPEKLAWVNSVYIRNRSAEELYNLIITDVQPDLKSTLSKWDQSKIYHVIELFKERVKTLKELSHALETLHIGPQTFISQDIKLWVGPEAIHHIQAIIEELQNTEPFSSDMLKNQLKELAKKLTVKLVDLAQPIRIALIGKASGPGVFELLVVVGKEESLAHMSALLDAARKI